VSAALHQIAPALYDEAGDFTAQWLQERTDTLRELRTALRYLESRQPDTKRRHELFWPTYFTRTELTERAKQVSDACAAWFEAPTDAGAVFSGKKKS